MQNKKRWSICCFVFGLLLSWPVCAEPLVSNIECAQRAGTKLVDITYDLTDAENASLFVTMRISKDAGTTWDVPCTSVSGNGIGLEVTPGTGKSIVWDAGADWNRQWSDQMKVEIMASALYLVVDLSEGPTATNYPVSYLTEIPSGGWTDEYKTTKLVLRCIPAGTFIMGSPENELGRNATNGENQRQVTLTKNFYVGVFEVTQRQWERVMGNWYCYFVNPAYRDSRPAEWFSYANIRGNNGALDWPADNAAHEDSFIGKLRAKTGLIFDLPTEAQWEYACRAGTTTALNSGKNLTSSTNCPNMTEVGRYKHNGGADYLGDEQESQNDTSGGTAKVGSYLPNAWGLYDMHGNVAEWCLDWFGTNHSSDAVTDPKGPAEGEYRVFRGGSFIFDARSCRSAYRGKAEQAEVWYINLGFRIVRVVP